MKTYIGAGARDAPPPMLFLASALSSIHGIGGWTLRTGGAEGMDSGFAFGAADSGPVQLFLPNHEYDFPLEDADTTRFYATEHPEWCDLATRADDREFASRPRTERELLARTAGMLLVTPTPKRVFVWTHRGRDVGGTGHLIRGAALCDIPVFNLNHPDHFKRICDAIGKFR